MKYDIDILFKAHNCRVVFVSEPNDSIDIENAVYARNKRYRCEINKVLAPSKKCGPFKLRNKKSVWKILKTTKRIKEEGPEFLTLQLKHLDLYYYMDRRIPALSYQQRFRTSVSYEVLNGDRSKLLLNDCYTLLDGKFVPNNGKSSFFNVAAFFEKYDDLEWVPYDLIWITDMSPDAFFEEFKRQNLSLDFYSFYSAKDGAITLFDTKGTEQSVVEQKKPAANGITPNNKNDSSKVRNMYSDAENNAFDKAKREGKTGLSVIMAKKDDHMIYAHIECGSVKCYDRLVSLRTNTVYKLISFPLDMTYPMIEEAKAKSINGLTQLFEYAGYDLDEIHNADSYKEKLDSAIGAADRLFEYAGYKLLQNYAPRKEEPDALSDLNKTVSAGDSGPLTLVVLIVMAYKDTEFHGEIFDIEEGDILVSDD